MKEIILQNDFGKAKAGEIYVQGLHGVPDLYYSAGDRDPDEWYWKKDSEKKDQDFIFYKNIKQLEDQKNEQIDRSDRVDQ